MLKVHLQRNDRTHELINPTGLITETRSGQRNEPHKPAELVSPPKFLKLEK